MIETVPANNTSLVTEVTVGVHVVFMLENIACLCSWIALVFRTDQFQHLKQFEVPVGDGGRN